MTRTPRTRPPTTLMIATVLMSSIVTGAAVALHLVEKTEGSPLCVIARSPRDGSRHKSHMTPVFVELDSKHRILRRHISYSRENLRRQERIVSRGQEQRRDSYGSKKPQ